MQHRLPGSLNLKPVFPEVSPAFKAPRNIPSRPHRQGEYIFMQLLVNLGTKGWDFTQELDEPSFRLVVVFARQHCCLLDGDVELMHG